jgi:hypothetical protein
MCTLIDPIIISSMFSFELKKTLKWMAIIFRSVINGVKNINAVSLNVLVMTASPF